MSNSPRVSIITINRNNSDGLLRTLNSIWNRQIYNSVEHIVIDGASTDNSVDVIRRFENKLAYWVSEPDSGIYNAMNKGIKRATGEYLLFLNSGDWLVDDVLANVFSIPFNEDIVYANLLCFYGEGNIVEHIYADKFSFAELIKTSLGHPCTFIRRELFNNNLYKEDYKIISDWIFWMEELVFNGRSSRHLDIFTTYFDMHGISSSEGANKFAYAEREMYLNRHHPYLTVLIREFSKVNRDKILDIISKHRIDELVNSPWLQRRLKPYISMLFFVKQLFKIEN